MEFMAFPCERTLVKSIQPTVVAEAAAAPAASSASPAARTPARSGKHAPRSGGEASRPASDRPSAHERRQLWAKRAGVLSALAAVCGAMVGWIALYGQEAFALFADGTQVRAWAESMGPAAALAMAGLVAVQVVFAFLPGEPLELGAGYAFGFWEGTAICLAGSLAGTLVIWCIVRTAGMRAVALFFPPEKLAEIAWVRDARKFDLVLFIAFLIPGTPKDLLTYVAALSGKPAWRIAAITTVGRIPSIVTSTLTAHFAAQSNWTATAISVAATIALVAGGALAYRSLAKREKARQEQS